MKSLGKGTAGRNAHKSVLPPLPTPPIVAQLAAFAPNNYTPRHNHCLDILIQGCVESFVEFFNLTVEVDHMDSASDKLASEGQGTESLEAQQQKTLFNNLEFLKTQLCEAEMASRQGWLLYTQFYSWPLQCE